MQTIKERTKQNCRVGKTTCKNRKICNPESLLGYPGIVCKNKKCNKTD